MDPTANTDRKAYHQLTAASQAQSRDFLGFNQVVQPALRHLLSSKGAVSPDLLAYAVTHIAEGERSPDQIKACGVFLSSINLKEEDRVHLLINLLRSSQTELAVEVLKSFKGSFNDMEFSFLAKFAIDADCVPFLDVLYQKQGKVFPQALDFALERGKEKIVFHLVNQGQRVDIFTLAPLEISPGVIRAYLEATGLANMPLAAARKLLSKAIDLGFFSVVEAVLAKYPALLGVTNADNKTPLQEAIERTKKEGAKLSHHLGAAVILSIALQDSSITDAFTPELVEFMERIAGYKEDFKDYFLKENADILGDVVDEYEVRKLVGHVYSLKETEQFKYEGTFADTAHSSGNERAIARVLKRDGDQSLIPKGEKERIADAFLEGDKAFKTLMGGGVLLEFVEKIQRGDLVILPTGHDGHHVEVFFEKGFMVVCNRGARKNNFRNIEAFRIDPAKMNEEVLKNILQVAKEKNGIAKSQEKRYRSGPFFADLAKQLSSKGEIEQDDYCRALSEISPEDQTVGNCAFAAPEAALRGVLGLSALLEAGPKVKVWGKALTKAKEASEQMSLIFRLQSLEDYLQHRRECVWGKKDLYLIRTTIDLLRRDLKGFSQMNLDPYPLVKELIDRG